MTQSERDFCNKILTRKKATTRLENLKDELVNNPHFEERIEELKKNFGVFKNGKEFRKWFRRKSSKVQRLQKAIEFVIEEFALDKNIGWESWIRDYYVSGQRSSIPSGRITIDEDGLSLRLHRHLTREEWVKSWPLIRENLEIYYGEQRNKRSKKHSNLARDKKFWIENKRRGKSPKQIAEEYSLIDEEGIAESAVRKAIKRLQKMPKKSNA